MTITDERPAAGFAAARRAMIESQLRPSGVNEPWVLAAMDRVPREGFVPDEMKAAAYTDRAVPLGEGRYLASPLFYGRLLTEAAPQLEDSVLVIGRGNFYLPELVKPLVGSLEVATAGEPGGYAPGAYSLILIDGAVEELPDSVAAALTDDGRIVTGVVERGVTRLAVGRKAAGAVVWLPLAEMGIPILPEFAAPRRWSF